MINNTAIDKKLDDYMSGQVTTAELESFLGANGVADVAACVAEHKAAMLAVQYYNLMQQVGSVHRQHLQTMQTEKSGEPARVISFGSFRQLRRLAAALVLTLAAAVSYQYITSSGGDLFNRLYEPYSVYNTRGTEAADADALVAAYQEKKYNDVVSLFGKIGTVGNRERFIAANAYMQLNQPGEAIRLYQSILQHNQTDTQKFYQDEAEYYLAMAYLKTATPDKALPLLTNIANDENHTYHNKIDRWTLFKLKWFGH